MQQSILENRDEQSIRMAQLWDNIDNNICQPALVGIRIFQGTETAKQFAQICPFSSCIYITKLFVIESSIFCCVK